MSEILILEGTVVHGQALGRRFGFPTANLSLPDGQPLPDAGVYASVAVLEDGARCPAVTNVGARPTVDDSGRATRWKTNLMDFSGDSSTGSAFGWSLVGSCAASIASRAWMR